MQSRKVTIKYIAASFNRKFLIEKTKYEQSKKGET